MTEQTSIAVVAEKPSVARDIARVLSATRQGDGYMHGNGYVVTWAIGHLVALAQPHGNWVFGVCRQVGRDGRPRWASSGIAPKVRRQAMILPISADVDLASRFQDILS